MARRKPRLDPRDEEGARIIRAYREVFNTPSGQAVLEDLRHWAGDNPFDQANPYTTAFNCGKLGMVQMIDRLLAPEE